MKPKKLVVLVKWALACQEVGFVRAMRMRLETDSRFGLRLIG